MIYAYTVHEHIQAQVFISYRSFLTRRLNETGIYYRRKRGDMILVYQLLHSMFDVDASTFATYTSTRGHNLTL